MAALLVSHRRPGFYCRVITEGEVEAGQEIVKIAVGPEQVTVAEIDALLYLPGHPRDALERALRIPALSPGWKASLQSLADQASRAGNVGQHRPDGRGASSPPPAWPGFRPLRVTAVHDESRPCARCRLADPDGANAAGMASGPIDHAAAAPEADQAAPDPQLFAVQPAGLRRYRISVKREPHGAASRYIHAHVKVGDLIDVAAPRGTFFLTDSDAPVSCCPPESAPPRCSPCCTRSPPPDRRGRSGGCTAPVTAPSIPSAPRAAPC